MNYEIGGRRRWRRGIAAVAVAPAISLWSQCALADEGGVSFWLPGTYGSLAAVPAQPGWSFATIYYHTSVDAGTGTSFVRGGGVEAGIKASEDLQMFAPN
jgi:hypothetical protein